MSLGMIGSEIKVLGQFKNVIATATTQNSDLRLDTLTNYGSGDRIVVICRAVAAGTTSNISFSVQDALDNAGAINAGSAATAQSEPFPAPASGDRTVIRGVMPVQGRPWLRLRATNSGTESYTYSILVLAIPSGL